jgi:hypothetical protein
MYESNNTSSRAFGGRVPYHFFSNSALDGYMAHGSSCGSRHWRYSGTDEDSRNVVLIIKS